MVSVVTSRLVSASTMESKSDCTVASTVPSWSSRTLSKLVKSSTETAASTTISELITIGTVELALAVRSALSVIEATPSVVVANSLKDPIKLPSITTSPEVVAWIAANSVGVRSSSVTVIEMSSSSPVFKRATPSSFKNKALFPLAVAEIVPAPSPDVT